MQQRVLLNCPQMTGLAESVVDRVGAAAGLRRAQVVWQRFEDDFPNLLIREVEGLRGSDLFFLACFDSPGTILEQLGVIHALPRYGAGSLTVILPYFPTATMERINREGEVATAKTLARLLSITPLSMNGPARLVVFDIHALQERFYFSDNVIPQLETALPLLKKRLAAMPQPEQVAVAFPDEGAWKRFGGLLGDWHQILCHKVRDGDARVVTIKEGEPAGKHVVIVDDLVKTGGTLIECQRALKARGALEVSAYVTHGVFPQSSWRRFCAAGFAKVWMTDSCPAVAATVGGQSPFEILSLAEPIAAMIHAAP